MAEHSPKKRLASKGWVTPSTAARKAASSDSMIYRAIRANQLEWIRIGGRIYVSNKSLELWLGKKASTVLSTLEEEDT